MKRSDGRILTTHTGSLPRPDDLAQLVFAQEEGRDASGLEGRVAAAVSDVVQRQVSTGIDVVDDGEMSKPSYATYVKDRLSGFGGESPTPVDIYAEEFPEWAQRRARDPSRARRKMPACIGPIELRDAKAVHRDIANLRSAVTAANPTDVFMTAVSPGTISVFLHNFYYPSEEAYIYALADAMKYEYRAIVDAGFVLQVDCPDLTSLGRASSGPEEVVRVRAATHMHVEALNYALEGLPTEQLRMHLCWGNWAGPHTHDIPLREIIDLVFQARPSAVSFEGANPRHEHEWAIFKDIRLPDGKIIIPGVIDTCTNFVEHPELVAQRITRYAELVGRENVIAGTDCGFGTFVVSTSVDPRIAWAKLASLVAGARMASDALW
ncbi:MAG TPA: cobalamin-independent methionine synthase II family protein [Chloroflexota bacterium]|nr:cobalamin-independent methionine synthase II family protein [Chloroflexota bacterium]